MLREVRLGLALNGGVSLAIWIGGVVDEFLRAVSAGQEHPEAQPEWVNLCHELDVVVEPFSEERYGVGYSKDEPEMCQWIVDTITEAYDDGDYEAAFEATLGPSGVEVPELPTMDACA